MSQKEWFDGRSVDDKMERCYWRRVGFAVFLGFVLAMLVGLQGCATPDTFQGICALKPMGAGDNGVHFFLTYCEAK